MVAPNTYQPVGANGATSIPQTEGIGAEIAKSEKVPHSFYGYNEGEPPFLSAIGRTWYDALAAVGFAVHGGWWRGAYGP